MSVAGSGAGQGICFERKNMRNKIILAVVLVLAAGMAFSAVRAEDTKVAEEAKLTDDKQALFGNVQLLSDSITLISTDYVEEVKVKDLIYGAVKGMMGTLDDYSQFLDPEGFREITEETKGEFGGIGIEIGVRDGVLTVIAPMEDTPAFEAGVEAGDKIVKIDGSSTREMTLDDAVKKLRGDIGTKIVLTVIREGTDKLIDFNIMRAIIKLKSIKEARIIEGNIGYVKIAEFQERTGPDLKEVIKKLRQEGAKSLIIDLRNNPGGLLDASVDAADLFLSQGTMIVYTEGRDPSKRMEFKAKKRTEFDDLALVVLVNKGSASAAEIFAGAVKDNKRGLVIGETTFGKGSVQTVIPLKDGSALRLTTAAYFTPAGKNLRDKGIEPDIIVERKKLMEETEGLSSEDKEKSRIFDKLESEENKGAEKDKNKDKDKAAKPEEKKPKDKATPEDEQQGGTENAKEAYDNQLAAAVNVLKGLRIFEGYKVSHPAPAVEAGAGGQYTSEYTSGQ